MNNDKLQRMGYFMKAGEDYAAARGVIYGMPMDFTTSFRPGTRFGPTRIREASYGLEEYSFKVHEALSSKSYTDVGDVFCPFGNVETSLANIEEVVDQIVHDGKVPLGLGGEHLCTLPALRAVHRRYPKLVVIHLDAHADTADKLFGERISHGTFLRRACEEFLDPKSLFQFGIRSGSEDEWVFGREYSHLYDHEVLPDLPQVLEELKGRPIYFTLDIDVCDPAVAPGTGTPEPGGIDAKEVLQSIWSLRNSQVVGFDLMEVLPALDESDRTSVLAAKIMREAILTIL